MTDSAIEMYASLETFRDLKAAVSEVEGHIDRIREIYTETLSLFQGKVLEARSCENILEELRYTVEDQAVQFMKKYSDNIDLKGIYDQANSG